MSISAPVLWTSSAAAAATDGINTSEWNAHGVSIDSRTLARGDLFVAIRGPRVDGHGFATNALAEGAAACMVDQKAELQPGTGPLLVVADTERALEDLGRAARDRCAARIVAVTGSVGKTGVKEALAHVLSRQGLTSATRGNLNNQWGLPLSLARMPADSDFGVLEMGMNHPGELTPLSKLARPHVAVITTIAPAHTEFFNDLSDVARAKAEIFAGLEPGGTVVLNRDNAYFGQLSDAAEDAGATNHLSFGRHEEAVFRLVDAALDDTGTRVRASLGGEVFDYRIGLPGLHWAMNSLAVLAAVAALGADVSQAAADLADLQPLKGRGARAQITIPGGVITLIDESYNASPVAMVAALEVLGACRPGSGGRRIAVLGDMLELGDQSEAMHRGLSGALIDNNLDLLYAAGPHMAALFQDIPEHMRGARAPDTAALAPALIQALRPGDLVMVKGSLGSRLGVIIDALKSLSENQTIKDEA